MEMSSYILSILRTQIMVMLSWGFHDAKAIENGLQFCVQGFLHKGKVQVIYDEGYDLFTVRLLNQDGSTKKVVDGVYLDGLVDTIDGMVERCKNYKDMVRNEYHLI